MCLVDKSHTHKINFATDLGAQKLTKLDEEIVRFDSVLDRIEKLMPEDLKVYDRIVEVRDAIFRLLQHMRGLDILEFAEPWVEPADLFWEREREGMTEKWNR